MRGIFATLALIIFTTGAPTFGLAQPALVTKPWPHDTSDLKPDPGVLYGRLPNGMSYVLLQTVAPQPIAMRLRIHAGSRNERDGQEGFAHFVEHMAFQGTKNLPKTKFEALLKKHGFAFGSDINAATMYGATDYTLNISSWETEDIEAGLFIIRETASNLTFDPGEVNRERAVVLAEERMRATPARQAAAAGDKALYTGLLYPRRAPIGLPASINAATSQSLSGFYKTWYRPQNATLIIVGVIDSKRVAKRIEQLFGDWQNPLTEPAIDQGAYIPQGLRAHVHTDPNLPEEITVNWVQPFTSVHDGQSARKVEFLDALAADVLNQRFADDVRRAEAPFASAAIEVQKDKETLDRTTLTLVPAGGKSTDGLASALLRVRQFREFGITHTELTRAIARMDAETQRGVRAKVTPSNFALTETLADNLDKGRVYLSAEQVSDLWVKLKPELTLAAVNAHIPAMFKGDGPAIIRVGPDSAGMNAPALKNAFLSAQEKPVSAFAETVTTVWPYTQFGAPVKRNRRMVLPQHDYVQFRYPNGITLNYKASQLEKDRILIRVRFEGGLRRFAANGADPLYLAWAYAPLEAGFKKIDPAGIERALTGLKYNIDFSIEDDAAYLTAETDRAGFRSQMRLLMAWLTDRSDRPEPLQTAIGRIAGHIKGVHANSEDVLDFYLKPLLTCADNRFRVPDADALAKATADDMIRVLDQATANAPISLTVVGDISEAAVETMMEQTLATLAPPPTSVAFNPDGEKLALPAQANTWRLYHTGRSDQGEAIVLFPTTGALTDTKLTRTLQLLSVILNERLRTEVREKRGLSYDAHAAMTASRTFRDFGYVYARAEIKPSDEALFKSIVLDVAKDLRTSPVADAELKPLREGLAWSYNDFLKSHETWASILPGLYGSDRVTYESRVRQQIENVSANDLLKAAQTYLVPDRLQYFIALPKGSGEEVLMAPACDAS